MYSQIKKLVITLIIIFFFCIFWHNLHIIEKRDFIKTSITSFVPILRPSPKNIIENNLIIQIT